MTNVKVNWISTSKVDGKKAYGYFNTITRKFRIDIYDALAYVYVKTNTKWIRLCKHEVSTRQDIANAVKEAFAYGLQCDAKGTLGM